MNILLLGKHGQLGRALRRALLPLGNLQSFGREDVDLQDRVKLAEMVAEAAPNWIVNAAAYTQVDNSEEQRDVAFAINAQAVATLAQAASRQGAGLLHYSTDYVFDGHKQRPYLEEDRPSPLNVYGASKLAGEQAALGYCQRAVVVRVGWLYGSERHNFLQTMLRLAQEKTRIEVVADQIGVPTSVEFVAQASALLIHRIGCGAPDSKGGRLYHLALGGQASWYDFAASIMDLRRQCPTLGPMRLQHILPITTDNWPQKAQRPTFSVLDSSKIAADFNLYLPHWRDELLRVMDMTYGMRTQTP